MKTNTTQLLRKLDLRESLQEIVLAHGGGLGETDILLRAGRDPRGHSVA